MSHPTVGAMLLVLTIGAILPVAATFYFFVFWHWFEFWRRHAALAYSLILGALLAVGIGAYLGRESLLAPHMAMPRWVVVIGWIVVGLSLVFGTIADRQIGFRVRSFAPFFETEGRIELVTTGAYGVVRHPIYSAGIVYQLGIFLVTGTIAVAIAVVIFGLGAAWFTRQEERRLVKIIDDPSAYDAYRSRVPALLPWPRP